MAWLINRPAGTHQRSVVPWGPHATEVSRGVITEFVVGGRTRTNASAEGEKSATAGIEPGSRHSEAAALPTELKLLSSYFVATLSCLAGMAEPRPAESPSTDSVSWSGRFLRRMRSRTDTARQSEQK